MMLEGRGYILYLEMLLLLSFLSSALSLVAFTNITFVSLFLCFFLASSGAAAVKSGAGSPLRGGPGAGQQPVQVVIKDSPIILAQVINSLSTIAVSNHLRHFSRWNERRFRTFLWSVRRVSDCHYLSNQETARTHEYSENCHASIAQ